MELLGSCRIHFKEGSSNASFFCALQPSGNGTIEGPRSARMSIKTSSQGLIGW